MVSLLKRLFPAELKVFIKRLLKPSGYYLARLDYLKRFMEQFVKPTPFKLEKIGVDHASYYVPVDVIQHDWVCYAAGVGEHNSFDLGLIEHFDCDVYAFDPTPDSIEFVQSTCADVPKYHFYPYGVWSGDEQIKLYVPADADHISHSATNIRETSAYILADVRSLPSIMQELKHTHIDLLKMNIEGAEYAVLESILEHNLVINVIVVQFEQPDRFFSYHSLYTFTRPLKYIRRLVAAGYVLARVDRNNCTFIHQSLINRAGHKNPAN